MCVLGPALVERVLLGVGEHLAADRTVVTRDVCVDVLRGATHEAIAADAPGTLTGYTETAVKVEKSLATSPALIDQNIQGLCDEALLEFLSVAAGHLSGSGNFC